MKKIAPLLFAAIFTLSSIALQGQQAATDEAQIQQLRANIQRMIENAPPQGSAEERSHRDALASLGNQLRDLLVEKRGALKSRIKNLETPDALPEVLAHVEQLKQAVEGINGEVQNIDRAFGQNLAPARAAAAMAQPAIQAPAQVAQPSPAETAFRNAVRNISTDDIREAAAPAEVATSEAVVTCNDQGRPASTTFSRLDESICGLASDLIDEDRGMNLAQDLDPIFIILTAQLLKTKTTGGESYAAFVSEATEKRTDQQMGAGPSTNGSTSIVSKGGVPYLFGLAVENGAAVQSTSDTTITFRVNPAGVINTFANKGFVTGFQQAQNDPVMNFLRKTSIGFSFDTSRGNQAGVFTGNKQQLSAISARVELFNDRDPRLKKYEADWEKFVANEGVKLAQEVWKTTVATVDFGSGRGQHKSFRDPALQAWLEQMTAKVSQVDASLTGASRINAIATVIREQAALVPVDRVSEDTIQGITGFAKQDKAYTTAKNSLLDKIAKGKLFTLDYTNTRAVSAPDTSNFNFIAATGTGSRVDLTANGSFTLFHKRPLAASPTSPRPGRFRDFQFAGQVLVPFKVGDLGQFDFWFSGRYERLLGDASTAAGGTMPGTRGDIAIGQFGLNVPITSLGIKFPISLTFANRTELVKEREIRGNFGFTFNWDTLLSKLKPF